MHISAEWANPIYQVEDPSEMSGMVFRFGRNEFCGAQPLGVFYGVGKKRRTSEYFKFCIRSRNE
jgi:hypothetical protein